MPLGPLDVDGIANGGAGVGRAVDGRVVFVRGALPGERVLVEPTTIKKRFAEGEVAEVLQASPHRRPVPCQARRDGCGGCDWLHVDEAHQPELRLRIAADALERIGRLPSPPVELGPALPHGGYRTVIRAAVRDGRAGIRSARSHDPVPTDDCLVAHPLAEELLVEGRFGPDATEVAITVGARTGRRMAVVTPTAVGTSLPDDVVVVGADEVAAGAEASITELVAGVEFRISAGSFFQCRPDGADVLVGLVAEALDGVPDGPLVDAYCGVGLFAGTVAGDRAVTAVERAGSSVRDARFNLGDRARVVEGSVERWEPTAASAVVADPARSGLGSRGVEVLVGTGAHTIVLVSCDAGSLGRDARLLTEAGYRLERSVVVDLFGQTSHLEVVSTFRRAVS